MKTSSDQDSPRHLGYAAVRVDYKEAKMNALIVDAFPIGGEDYRDCYETAEVQLSAWAPEGMTCHFEWACREEHEFHQDYNQPSNCGIHVCAHGIACMLGGDIHKEELDVESCAALCRLFRQQVVSALS